ncbi:hypothetical protein JJL56_23990 [Azospirillum sp. YIM DDC1]|uniref:Uncharacterized protein n=1 Tax=Azospirillum aestuarii TaxID=2802052 RepID=A0ABS1I4B9_9PROT|nr:hypothetical protein [Azospirillum aestuarii]MBK4721918.1 hypothetical protein [Azospirillum aestuarii]
MTIKLPSTGAAQAAQPQHQQPVPAIEPAWAPGWPRLTPREIRQIVLDTLG